MSRKPVLQHGEDLRGLPTYTVPEAASFLGMSDRTLRSWFAGKSRLFQPEGGDSDSPLLSFRNLAEAYVVQMVRLRHRVPMPSVRRALAELRKTTSNPHPLLSEKLIVCFRRLMLASPAPDVRRSEVVDLSSFSQLAMPEIVEPFAKRIVWDSSGEPIRLLPWRLAEKYPDETPVSIDPRVMSGRLVVTGTRIPVRVLWHRKASGESVEHLADEYGLSPDTIRKALGHLAQAA